MQTSVQEHFGNWSALVKNHAEITYSHGTIQTIWNHFAVRHCLFHRTIQQYSIVRMVLFSMVAAGNFKYPYLHHRSHSIHEQRTKFRAFHHDYLDIYRARMVDLFDSFQSTKLDDGKSTLHFSAATLFCVFRSIPIDVAPRRNRCKIGKNPILSFNQQYLIVFHLAKYLECVRS